MENRNFILPETEATVNKIISEVAHFFDIVRITAMVMFLAYLSLRLVFFSSSIWFDVLLLAVYFVQTVFIALEVFKRLKFERSVFVLNVTKRVTAFIMLVLFISDIFVSYESIQLWQILSGIFMGLGWILLVLGDVFQFTVPRYCDMVLSSFKNDIEIRGLVARGMAEVKSSAKDAIKNNGGKKIIAATGGIVAVDILEKFVNKMFRKRTSTGKDFSKDGEIEKSNV